MAVRRGTFELIVTLKGFSAWWKLAGTLAQRSRSKTVTYNCHSACTSHPRAVVVTQPAWQVIAV